MYKTNVGCIVQQLLPATPRDRQTDRQTARRGDRALGEHSQGYLRVNHRHRSVRDRALASPPRPPDLFGIYTQDYVTLCVYIKKS